MLRSGRPCTWKEELLYQKLENVWREIVFFYKMLCLLKYYVRTSRVLNISEIELSKGVDFKFKILKTEVLDFIRGVVFISCKNQGLVCCFSNRGEKLV